MPNHVTTILTFSGPEEKIKGLRENLKTEKSNFDFSKIIPMPEELDISENNFSSFAEDNKNLPFKLFAEKFRKECIEFEELSFKSDALNGIINYLKYGYNSWYPWSKDHWGTKWNSYEVEYLDNNKVKFQTAWNFPYPVIQRLSLIYPEILIVAEYYDEDFGYNLGSYTFKAGILIDGGALEDDSQEGYKLLWEICPYAKDYLEKVDGKFIRI